MVTYPTFKALAGMKVMQALRSLILDDVSIMSPYITGWALLLSLSIGYTQVVFDAPSPSMHGAESS